MRCPILPVGTVVQGPIPADPAFVRELQLALARAGVDPGPADGQYGPSTAAALRAFQDQHAEATGIDRALEIVDKRFRYASCATYRALGLRCSSVYCAPAVWAPVVGSEQAALVLCAAVAAAADQKLINLSCPLPPEQPARGAPDWAVVAASAVVGLSIPAIASGVQSGRRGGAPWQRRAARWR